VGLDKEIVNIEPGEWRKLEEALIAHQNKNRFTLVLID
jgi:hypothetical protein